MEMEKERGMSSILLQYHSDRREEGGRGLGLSMSNALQVVTEALSSTTKLPPFCQIEIKREDCQPPVAPHDNEEFEDDDDDEDEEELQISQQQQQQQAFQNVTIQQHQLNHNHNHPGLIGKTIVASDNDVTNGFVKDGKMLPYVFEANESGVRKRSSKILPVCGVCGKRFVCVTTMKRHLVTHTGEKPFSCKVCGKQYTQKGNLRVHERTHRNDRPFECNICHQKFYRKEPMQKHQWRQHGVVHFKSRPLPVGGNNNNNNNNSNNPTAAATATSTTTANSSNNDNVLYTSLVDHIQTQQQQQQEKGAEKPSCYVRPLSEIVVAAAAPRSTLPSVAHLLSIPAAPAIHRVNEFDQPKLLLPTITLPSISQLQYRVSEAVAAPLALPSTTSVSFGTNPSSPEREEEMSVQKIIRDLSPGPEAGPSAAPQTSPKPIKLRMKFAYQKEQEDINHKREEEERQIQEDEENEDEDCEGSLGENLGELKLRSSSTSPIGHDPAPDSRAPAISDPFQCVGCCVVFAHKPALKAHQICPEEKERPFKCCKCGYKFRQKAHLQKHQWRIHRRRYCDQDESPVATTITMQDIINHGVEKSLREIPVYHGKTSSKYYSEILGLEYSGSDDNNSNSSSSSSTSNDVQPLDLSPVKKKPETQASAMQVIKIRELENNPLLNQPPLPRSPIQRLPEMATTSGMMTSGNSRSTSSLSISPSSISVVESFPAWKKQRTEPSAAPTTTTTTTPTTHRALPPISILQKPPVMSLISRKTDGSTYTSYKHSSWIRETSNPVATDLSTARKSGDQQQHHPDYLRDQLSRLQGQNARTV